jgi:hypothetical protein
MTPADLMRLQPFVHGRGQAILAGLLEDLANAPTGQIRLNTDKTAVIDKGYHYRKIDANTQRGGKLQLVNRYAGVAAYGNYNPAYSFWTHYAPLPTFDPKEA